MTKLRNFFCLNFVEPFYSLAAIGLKGVKKMDDEALTIITEDDKDYPKIEGLRVMTPEKLIESLPKKVFIKKPISPEVGIIRAKVRWPGHCHDSDIDAIIDSLKKAYRNTEFEHLREESTHASPEDMFSIGRIYKTADKETGKIDYLKISGVHPVGEIDLCWTLSDKDAIKKFFYASMFFLNLSGRKQADFTVVNASYGRWDFGGTWSLPPNVKVIDTLREKEKKATAGIEDFVFTTARAVGEPRLFINNHDVATIFMSTAGNRDEYEFETALPAPGGYFDLYTSRETFNKVSQAIYDCYEKILKDNVIALEVKTSIRRGLPKYIGIFTGEKKSLAPPKKVKCPRCNTIFKPRLYNKKRGIIRMLPKTCPKCKRALLERGDVEFGFKMTFKTSDLEFKPYRGIQSVISLANKMKAFFDAANLTYKTQYGRTGKVTTGGVVRYPSIDTAWRTFCPICGTTIECEEEGHMSKLIGKHLKTIHNTSIKQLMNKRQLVDLLLA